jgi:16S rRNA processing protein RimM
VRAARVEIGVVSKAHGIRGEVVAIPHDPASTSLGDVAVIHVGGVRREVVRSRDVGGAFLMALEGIADRDAAAALRGAVIEVDRDELELDENDVLLADLVGCRCVLPDGTAWGEIVAVELGLQDRLVIRDGKVERQLPVVDAFIASIDVEAGVVTVTPPEGLPEDPVDGPEASSP